MRIAVVGKGNVGGGLAGLWERAGPGDAHWPRRGRCIRRRGGAARCMPGAAVMNALEKLDGIGGKMVIDATNLDGIHPPEGFASNAEFVKSKTNGPTAKSFNINFATLYGRLAEARARPSNLWSGDDEAREVVERSTATPVATLSASAASRRQRPRSARAGSSPPSTKPGSGSTCTGSPRSSGFEEGEERCRTRGQDGQRPTLAQLRCGAGAIVGLRDDDRR